MPLTPGPCTEGTVKFSYLHSGSLSSLLWVLRSTMWIRACFDGPALESPQIMWNHHLYESSQKGPYLVLPHSLGLEQVSHLRAPIWKGH